VDLLSRAGSLDRGAAFVSPKMGCRRWLGFGRGAWRYSGAQKGVRYAALTAEYARLMRMRLPRRRVRSLFRRAQRGVQPEEDSTQHRRGVRAFRPHPRASAPRGQSGAGLCLCVVKCPFDGAVYPSKVAEVADACFRWACYEVSLGDTIGAGHADTIARMLLASAPRAVPVSVLAGHLSRHQTVGRG